MKELLFGTAGIPNSTEPRNTIEGIRRVKQLGLGAMELEFVRSVNIKAEKAPAIRKVAEKADVVLTCHAPYFINLNSQDPAKLKASIERILNSARILNLCGGWSVCFHAGFYMKMPSKQVFSNVRDSIEVIVDKLKEEDNKIWIRPEIGGKTTSWGSLEEIIKVSQELDQVLPCIDWAHMHARSLGKNNSLGEFRKILEALEKGLGKDALKRMHCHVEGVEIGKTGERFHKNLGETDYQYKDLMKVFHEFQLKGVIISESPNIEEDALLLQKNFHGL